MNETELDKRWNLPDFEKLDLNAWEERFYKRGRKELGKLTPSRIWLRSVENAGTRVAEFIRREEYQKAVKSLGNAFGLLCYFVRRFRQDHEMSALSDIAWAKYPGMCYECADKIQEDEVRQEGFVSCMCLGMRGKAKDPKKKEIHLALARQMVKKRPKTLDEWSDMIRAIYKEAHSVLPISAICLHFIEEIGEVTGELYVFDELRNQNAPDDKLKQQIVKLEKEIADTFSWIFGLLNKIDQLFEKARDYYKREAKLYPLKASRIAKDALEIFPRQHE